MNEQELMHYGIPGMKWGVRKSSAQLGNRVGKLQAKNDKISDKVSKLNQKIGEYTKKSDDIKRNATKYEATVARAKAKKAKYDQQLYREASKKILRSDYKVAKLTKKSMRQQAIIEGTKAKVDYNKYYLKSKDLESKVNKAKNAMAKNEKLMKTYKSTIKSIDAGTIEQGRLFMKYED